MKCPFCSASQGRCATTSSGRPITECTSCGRVVEERQFQPHHLFHLRAQDNPLCLVTSDLPTPPRHQAEDEEDPFEHTGFITAFSTWSLEPTPLSFRSSLAFSGHLAELERTLELANSNSSTSNSNPSTVVVDNLRAYMQIIDVASILGLDSDISDHAFQLFRDCCSATCLRNRSVEALATAALVQAIREAQEPRTLQEISIAANVPQKEIGKYIKILGEALQLSQPINSNSISVHMPRFCTLLQLNKSAQELATHIGEVVINKCFCTRRNPISISAAAIYLACQLEDKRKTQAEICKVTGLTEVTLRKVYKELLENWDDLLPSNYTPAVPPEKAFPTTAITSGRSSSARVDTVDLVSTSSDKDKQVDNKSNKPMEPSGKGKNDAESNGNSGGFRPPSRQGFRQPWLRFGNSVIRTVGEENPNANRGDFFESQSNHQDSEEMADKQKMDTEPTVAARPSQFSSPPTSGVSTITWQFRSSSSSGSSPILQPPPRLAPGFAELKGIGYQNGGKNSNHSGDNK
ncbi:Plant-specific TFIIB- protein 1 [Turnera subulata]|uniref:Plant-specific TFIIB- protein 1 n=1 Tax=Turnera subulata TaxID=218843 RepID=A0A9Q0G2J6_9ROSI|nr:Plant-specific TFIIB- protein 1 [Turnera subulata]